MQINLIKSQDTSLHKAKPHLITILIFRKQNHYFYKLLKSTKKEHIHLVKINRIKS